MGRSLQPDDRNAGLTAGSHPRRDPRIAAFHVLRDVRAGGYADRAAARRFEGLTGRDRALALEMAFGAIRLRARLDVELRPLLHRPLASTRPDLVDWLRLGLLQLRELRVPNHAAVHETVAGVGRTLGREAAGVANAVLRRATREGRPAGLFPSLQTDPVGHLSTWGSHPRWLVERWLHRWPLASVLRLVENDNAPPPVILRLLDADTAPPAEAEDQGLRLEGLPYGSALYRLLEGDPAQAVRCMPAVIQDPAAAAVVDYVGVAIEGPVLDACAAPGGKAIALAHAAPRARPFVAGDRSLARLRQLAEAAHRTAADIRAVAMDGRAPALGRARTVVLDVPCTGTGVLRRRVDARWRLTPERLESLIGLQRELLDGCAGLVEPGGLLVYATCSLEREENEDQVEAFLARWPDFERDPRGGNAPVPPEFLSPDGDLRILPWLRDTDGAFASRLRRKGRS